MKNYKMLIRWSAKDRNEARLLLEELFSKQNLDMFIEEDNDEL